MSHGMGGVKLYRQHIGPSRKTYRSHGESPSAFRHKWALTVALPRNACKSRPVTGRIQHVAGRDIASTRPPTAFQIRLELQRCSAPLIPRRAGSRNPDAFVLCQKCCFETRARQSQTYSIAWSGEGVHLPAPNQILAPLRRHLSD